MDTDKILLEGFIRSHPLEAAQIIEGLKDEEIAAILNNIPTELTVNIISLMNSYKVAKCLELLKKELAAVLIEKIDIQLVELIIRQCEKPFRDNILNSISPKLASALRQKLEHGANTVGSLMNPIAFGLRKELSIQEATDIVKQEKNRVSHLVPIIDIDGKLEGILKLNDLFFEENESQIVSIMKTEIPKFMVDASIDSVADHPAWFEYQSIPVVDFSDKLLGILNFEALYKNKMNANKGLSKHVVETSNSLGELYRIGLSGFLQSVSK